VKRPLLNERLIINWFALKKEKIVCPIENIIGHCSELSKGNGQSWAMFIKAKSRHFKIYFTPRSNRYYSNFVLIISPRLKKFHPASIQEIGDLSQTTPHSIMQEKYQFHVFKWHFFEQDVILWPRGNAASDHYWIAIVLYRLISSGYFARLTLDYLPPNLGPIGRFIPQNFVYFFIGRFSWNEFQFRIFYGKIACKNVRFNVFVTSW
jgi:hypothetical protein